MEVVASLFQGRTAAVQCGLFTHKSVPVIFEPPCILAHSITVLNIGTTLPFCFVMWYNISIFLGKSHSRVKRTSLNLVLYKEKLGNNVMIMIE